MHWESKALLSCLQAFTAPQVVLVKPTQNCASCIGACVSWKTYDDDEYGAYALLPCSCFCLAYLSLECALDYI